MSRRTEVVVEARPGHDDDLLLPRPPGVLRRFWARHPLLTDILVVVSAFLLTAPFATIRANAAIPPTAAEVALAVGLVIAGCAALLLRRRRPIAVFAVALLPSVALPPSLGPTGHILLGFAVYALAVYRSSRACWIAFGTAVGAIAVHALVTAATSPDTMAVYAITSAVSGAATLLIGALIGVNVGGRRRYLEALIDRSRQLATERDQQAQLAAAAERTRIAREMHDIVSHSLTVIVALSEGAVAATSPERARQASRGAADTARSALEEMRAMLGVLRARADDASPLEPLEPVDPAQVVDAAQRAGYPVSLETNGSASDAPRGVRFALGRVVQEGVTNAMRHAPRASAVRVRVIAEPARVVVAVRNDGVSPASVGRSGGYGLRGLRERVELVGGHLDAGHAGGDEWMLRADLPLSPAAEEAP